MPLIPHPTACISQPIAKPGPLTQEESVQGHHQESLHRLIQPKGPPIQLDASSEPFGPGGFLF